MEGIEKTEAPEIKKHTLAEQLELEMDSLLNKNYITKESKVGNVTFTLKTLSSDEYLQAESIYIATLANVPADVVQRVRTISGLSFAIIAVNGISTVVEDAVEQAKIHDKVHALLMGMPPSTVDRIYRDFVELTQEQSRVFADLGDNIENF